MRAGVLPRLVAAASLVCLAGAAAAPPPGHGAPPARPVARVARTPARPVPEVARDARASEDHGAYGRAAEVLRELRRRVAADADLELALALDEARSGAPDSAWARLDAPLLRAALVDSMPLARRVEYGWERERHWTDGGFGGWHWYVARARAEVAASLGRWDEALEAARLAVAARPMSGKDWLILATCAGRAGQPALAEAAALEAGSLDPTLPEAHHLAGLHAWRAGRRAEALERFARAAALDSLHLPSVRARQRLRFFPSAAPDSLPTELLTGVRRTALLTAPEGPKTEEFHQMDTPARLESTTFPAFTDPSLAGRKPVELVIQVLVDEHGRAAVHELPWFTHEQLAPQALAQALAELPTWRFTPAVLRGEPRRSWVSLPLTFKPS